MAERKRTSAVEILRGRYVKDDPERCASVETERINAEVARLICDLRTEAGLTQGELAKLVGTTQSVISRLEDADYAGHSLSMLSRIAAALQKRVTVVMTDKDRRPAALQYAFQLCVQMLRRERGLTVNELAAQAGIDRDELIAIERDPVHRPSRATLGRLSSFYGIPERRLLALAGAGNEESKEIREQASRFAARSESFAALTEEEKTALDEFVTVLKEDD